MGAMDCLSIGYTNPLKGKFSLPNRASIVQGFTNVSQWRLSMPSKKTKKSLKKHSKWVVPLALLSFASFDFMRWYSATNGLSEYFDDVNHDDYVINYLFNNVPIFLTQYTDLKESDIQQLQQDFIFINADNQLYPKQLIELMNSNKKIYPFKVKPLLLPPSASVDFENKKNLIRAIYYALKQEKSIIGALKEFKKLHVGNTKKFIVNMQSSVSSNEDHMLCFLLGIVFSPTENGNIVHGYNFLGSVYDHYLNAENNFKKYKQTSNYAFKVYRSILFSYIKARLNPQKAPEPQK